MMNFPGVYFSDEKMHDEMAETRISGKVIGGHYASLDLGLPFHGYVAGGPEDDHEGTRVEDAVARLRQGMKAMFRLGSGWDDIDDQIPAYLEMGLDPRHIILVTDDSHAQTLVKEGHINRAVKRAIQLGVDPIIAIQMATLNTAEHFGVARDMGQIAPGRFADVLLVSDLTNFEAEVVIAKGVPTAENGELLIDIPGYSYPDDVKTSVKLGRILSGEDFVVPSSVKGKVEVNVIGVIETQAPTNHLRIEMDVVEGELFASRTNDIAKIALVERHQGTGELQLGFVHGFGLTASCAIGSTVAHDSHHMIVVGTDDDAMAAAANELARVGGGQVVVKDGEVIASIELPIAGLMSNERAEVVAEKTEGILAGFRECGSSLTNPIMQVSLLALVVIPELRISDKGLVDVTKFELIPLISE
jgi:adenine deaminase